MTKNLVILHLQMILQLQISVCALDRARARARVKYMRGCVRDRVIVRPAGPFVEPARTIEIARRVYGGIAIEELKRILVNALQTIYKCRFTLPSRCNLQGCERKRVVVSVTSETVVHSTHRTYNSLSYGAERHYFLTL